MSTTLIMPAGTANIKELFKGCFVQTVVDGQVSHRAMTEQEKSDVVSAVEMCFSEKADKIASAPAPKADEPTE